MAPAVISGMWAGAFAGVFALPTNGSQIAAANFDADRVDEAGHQAHRPLVLPADGDARRLDGGRRRRCWASSSTDPWTERSATWQTAAASTEAPGIDVGAGAVFLGVGAMVGAGIFALLGEAGAIAGSAVWVSFLIGGIDRRAARATRSRSSACGSRRGAASCRSSPVASATRT